MKLRERLERSVAQAMVIESRVRAQLRLAIAQRRIVDLVVQVHPTREAFLARLEEAATDMVEQRAIVVRLSRIDTVRGAVEDWLGRAPMRTPPATGGMVN